MSGRVLVVGSYNQDLVWEVDALPAPGETRAGLAFRSGPGGKGFNQAVAAARAGAATTFVGALGADALAEVPPLRLGEIEPQTGMARRLVGSVALEAPRGEDRPHLGDELLVRVVRSTRCPTGLLEPSLHRADEEGEDRDPAEGDHPQATPRRNPRRGGHEPSVRMACPSTTPSRRFFAETR